MTMTISEALKRMDSLVDSRGNAMDAKAWNLLRSWLEEGDADLAAVYALGKYDGKRIEVNDEMAETALRVWRSCDAMMHAHAAMKAALVAALGE